MRRIDAGAMTALIGGFALYMGLTPTHLLYIRPSMTKWLVLSGVILVLVGGTVLFLGWRADRVAAAGAGDDHDHDHAHADDHAHDHEQAEDETRPHHHHATRIGWLLAIPLCVAVAVGSNPLGSYAAGRQNGQRTLPPGTFNLQQYLTANSFGGQAPALRSIDFERAEDDAHQRGLLAQHAVTLTGFVVHDEHGHGRDFLLTRFLLSCCAADAIAVQQVVPVSHGAVPKENIWYEVVATLDVAKSPAPGSLDPPVLDVQSMHTIPTPQDVYEYPP